MPWFTRLATLVLKSNVLVDGGQGPAHTLDFGGNDLEVVNESVYTYRDRISKA